MLAISSINEHGKKTGLGNAEKIIITCEFITHLNKDDDFNEWLNRREKNGFHTEEKK